jgi:chromosome segregation ATPase
MEFNNHSEGLEHDIKDLLQRNIARRSSETLPTVEIAHSSHHLSITRLTAEAVQKQHEVSARAVEAVGADLKMYSTKLEQMLHECDAAMKQIAELAEAIREEGKRKYAQVEHTSSMIASVVDTCKSMRDRIVSPPVTVEASHDTTSN